MKSFHKTASLGVRMTKEFRAKLRRAAELESRSRHEEVSSGDLLVDLAEPGVDRILAAAEKQVA